MNDFAVIKADGTCAYLFSGNASAPAGMAIHPVPESLRDVQAHRLELRDGVLQEVQPQPLTEAQLAQLENERMQMLLMQIDGAADNARRAVAGDPLRAVEYDRAASEAQAFAAADYQGEVPPMVAAWAINGRTPQQAAESILQEAAQYTAALVQLRTVRLQAKEQIRALMAADQLEQAQQLAAQTIAAIEAAVAGIGNNAGV